jgi:hypothetical protein
MHVLFSRFGSTIETSLIACSLSLEVPTICRIYQGEKECQKKKWLKAGASIQLKEGPVTACPWLEQRELDLGFGWYILLANKKRSVSRPKSFPS